MDSLASFLEVHLFANFRKWCEIDVERNRNDHLVQGNQKCGDSPLWSGVDVDNQSFFPYEGLKIWPQNFSPQEVSGSIPSNQDYQDERSHFPSSIPAFRLIHK